MHERYEYPDDSGDAAFCLTVLGIWSVVMFLGGFFLGRAF